MRLGAGYKKIEPFSKFLTTICKLVSKEHQKRFTLFFVAPPGFEPRQTEPKSVVLPLYYGAAFVWDGKIRLFFLTSKKTSYFFYPHRINHLDNSSFTFSTTFSGPNHSIQA